MPKSDLITQSIIEINRLAEGIIGFQNLIPEGTDYDDFTIAVRMILEKIHSDLDLISNHLKETL